MIRPPAVYGIADGEALGLPSASAPSADGSVLSPAELDRFVAAVAAMADAGIQWIQIRLKSSDDRTFFRILEACIRRVENSESRLWVDDRADLAALFPVLGVHVGQSDLPPSAARRILSSESLIGLSCHDEAQILRADRDPSVDVVACGPVFATMSKKNPDPTIGLEGVRAARAATGKPLVAIGGIDLDNARRVLEAGADTVVVLGALCRGDVARNSRRWVAALEDVNESE